MLRSLALALGCATAFSAAAQGLFDDNEARRRVEVLRQEMAANQREVAEQLKKLNEVVAGASDRSALLQLSSQVDTLSNELARMRGQLELLANQGDTAERRQKDLYLDIDTRLRKLEQAREQAATQPSPPATTGAADAEASPAETRAYQAALDQFKLGNYALAVSAMQGFLVTYPNSKLAPNAQYWVGMAHSGQRNYKEAIAAQRKLLAGWPDSEKAPDAMLSIASAQETMGDRKNAQKTLEELLTKFPKSSAAVSAKQRLAAFSKR
ncbi:MAG: tol-pal system protein YbgF [Betaproteobacteria bacterium]|jgi:tol-pal system protein YbgF|nr:tol-pal system protein YbgF [Betaproteobacteria bacterium]